MTNNWLHKSTRLHFQVHSWPQFAIYRFWQKFTVQKKEKRKPSVVFCKICELGVSIIQDGQWQKNIATFWAGLQSLLSPKVTEIIHCGLVSWESEATPSATPFFKTKLAVLPNYECPGLICLALRARRKFGLILVIKFFLVEVMKKSS